MATATVYRHAMSAATSPSRPTLLPSPSTTSIRRSFLMPAAGSVVRLLGAERFQKELLAQLAAAQRSAEQQRLVSWLGPASESYLRRLADTDRSLTRQVRELLLLVREYGPDAVAAAVTQAHTAGAFGADYIANLLRQQRIRRDVQPPLRFQNPQLNELATDPLSLADYDSFILRSKKDSDDLTATETESTEPSDDEPATGSDAD